MFSPSSRGSKQKKDADNVTHAVRNIDVVEYGNNTDTDFQGKTVNDMRLTNGIRFTLTLRIHLNETVDMEGALPMLSWMTSAEHDRVNHAWSIFF